MIGYHSHCSYPIMNNSSQSLASSPVFPGPLALPLGLIPGRLNSTLLVQALNRLFRPELTDGELDFLEHRIMQIEVVDARLRFHITLTNGQLQAANSGMQEDLSISGSVYDFLLLATKREDPDTLFFNRRLKLGGNTELGLYVKNFLDALELEGRIGPLLKLMNGATSLIGRFG
jgi:predicted lipid carrier protein YhbT